MHREEESRAGRSQRVDIAANIVGRNVAHGARYEVIYNIWC